MFTLVCFGIVYALVAVAGAALCILLGELLK